MFCTVLYCCTVLAEQSGVGWGRVGVINRQCVFLRIDTTMFTLAETKHVLELSDSICGCFLNFNMGMTS